MTPGIPLVCWDLGAIYVGVKTDRIRTDNGSAIFVFVFFQDPDTNTPDTNNIEYEYEANMNRNNYSRGYFSEYENPLNCMSEINENI